MNNYQIQIQTLIDSIRPAMENLGEFAFQGSGDIDTLRECFIKVYEAAIEGKRIYEENFHNTPLPEFETVCGNDTDISPVKSFYERLKSDDFCPMPFDAPLYGEYTMTLNHLFIALQKAGK